MSLERSFIDRPRQTAFARKLTATTKRPADRTIHLPVFRDFSGNIFRLAVTMKSVRDVSKKGRGV
ncbi:MAG: hypothetical protein ABJY83_00730 [Roseibium sp.]